MPRNLNEIVRSWIRLLDLAALRGLVLLPDLAALRGPVLLPDISTHPELLLNIQACSSGPYKNQGARPWIKQVKVWSRRNSFGKTFGEAVGIKLRY